MKTAGGLVSEGDRRKQGAALDVARIRQDFPILNQLVNGKPLVYLDNAATSHKPRIVIDAVSRFYERDNSNVHRGLHQLSERSTRAYEGARTKVQRFIGAADIYGLPVSTTQVLSSGVAGTMAANRSGLQMATIRNLLMAWVLTLPAAILLSGSLYWLFSHLF